MAATPTVLRSSFRDILSDVRTHLVEQTGLDDHLVRVIAREALPPEFLGSQHIILRPRNPEPQQEWVEGAGRVATVIRRNLAVILRTPGLRDQSDQDTHWLSDATDGHFVLEEAIVDALQMYFPDSDNQDHLVIEPMRLVPSTAPSKEYPQWGITDLEFSILYSLSLDQTIQ